MTCNTIAEPRTTSKASHSNPIEKTDFPLLSLTSDSSEAGRIAREQSIRRPKLPKMARFSLRQSSLVVPKPSYLKRADSSSWNSPTENPDEVLALSNPSLGAEKGTKPATSNKTKDRPDTERSRKAVTAFFVISTTLLYVIFRMLER